MYHEYEISVVYTPTAQAFFGLRARGITSEDALLEALRALPRDLHPEFDPMEPEPSMLERARKWAPLVSVISITKLHREDVLDDLPAEWPRHA
ncbi:hypothetical protein [Caldimonas sp. KR1-144]|uniref:hypothetical protein n=1 Tax=Caldimonas sp. KR1-144 TaxID=3400911 RepID=UPI003BFD6C9E